MGKWIPQQGKEWLPRDSEGRRLDWGQRMKPRRLASISFGKPYDFEPCDLCFEEAVWHCDHCRMKFCRFEECKKEHEWRHTVSRLGGPDDNAGSGLP